MRILLIYHFFYPDNVISARLFSDLACGLVASGHQITVFTSNHCIRSNQALPLHEQWNGMEIHRFGRPDFKQGSNIGRLMNSIILQRKWVKGIRECPVKFDAIILGTDPQFGYLMFPALRKLDSQVRLIHWCFDLYPEAVMATGNCFLRWMGKLFRPLAHHAYEKVDVMVDIGECMRNRLIEYHHNAVCATATPWALAESENVTPIPCDLRKKMFGNAELCFLYSGTVGQAHDIIPFIELARKCRQRNLPVGFCFAGYGNCYGKQTASISPEDTNITLAGFASEEELAMRLSAADFHLISLKAGWEGIVVPSKFFGALAIGRPVLFSGPPSSEINRWISHYGLGYHLDDSFLDIINQLLENSTMLNSLKQNALAIYQKYFSKKAMLQTWLDILNNHASETGVCSGHSSES